MYTQFLLVQRPVRWLYLGFVMVEMVLASVWAGGTVEDGIGCGTGVVEASTVAVTVCVSGGAVTIVAREPTSASERVGRLLPSEN